MPIHSITDIVKQPLSKYSTENIIKDLDELKQNGAITKIKDFDKLMTYFMKSKSFMKYIYTFDTSFNYAQIFEKIIDMHPENGIYTDEQMLYLCQKISISKKLMETLLNRGYNMKYEHLVAYLSGILNMSIYNNYDFIKENIYYIIKAFVDRKNISEDEYVDISNYNNIESYILFRPYYFKQSLCVEMDESDKKFMSDFITKFKHFDKFYNHLICYEQKSIVLQLTSNHDWIIRNDILNKYKDDDVFLNDIINHLGIHHHLVGLDYYEIILDPIFEKQFNNKYSNLNYENNTIFICNFYNYFCFTVAPDLYDKFTDFFEYYNKKFDNIIDRLKKINNKITLNNYLITSSNYKKICNIYALEKINIEKLDASQRNINVNIFEQMYSGEYNTELLNKCIKLNFNNELINFLLKNKQINFDNETLRYAIYTRNLGVITHMLDNKYIGSDKDLLYNIYSGQFSIDLRNLYKKHNILITDEVYKEFKMRSISINYQFCINGENNEHMKKLDEELEKEYNKIFPFNTYNNCTDYTFYYDMAKRGELTLDIISKIHHVVGADGIKHLIRLYMEFNHNITNNIIKQIDEKPKKIVKKIVKKVTKKVNF